MCRAADWTREARRRQRTRRRQQTLVYHTPIAVHAQFLPLQAELGQRKKKNVRVIKNSHELYYYPPICVRTLHETNAEYKRARVRHRSTRQPTAERESMYTHHQLHRAFFLFFFPSFFSRCKGGQWRRTISKIVKSLGYGSHTVRQRSTVTVTVRILAF